MNKIMGLTKWRFMLGGPGPNFKLPGPNFFLLDFSIKPLKNGFSFTSNQPNPTKFYYISIQPWFPCLYFIFDDVACIESIMINWSPLISFIKEYLPTNTEILD